MKTLIAVPCMDMVHSRFMTSLLGMRRVGEIHYDFKLSSLIYDSRNQIAVDAIENEADRVMWLDSDILFEPDLMERLSADMDTGLPFVSALYFKRSGKPEPVLYENIEPPQPNPETGILQMQIHPYFDYAAQEEIFPVDGCGFGACMMSTEVIKQVWDKHGPPFAPFPWAGEDISFCYRLKLLGIPVYCDRTIQVGHIGNHVYNEPTYLKQKAGEWPC